MVETSASFSLRADELVPAEVTALLGIAPTAAWARGDVFTNRTGPHEQPWGIWRVDSRKEGVQAAELEHHIRYLLERLEPRRASLARFLRDPKYLVQTYLWYVGTGGFTLSSSLLGRLCTICNLVNLSFFEIDEKE